MLQKKLEQLKQRIQEAESKGDGELAAKLKEKVAQWSDVEKRHNGPEDKTAWKIKKDKIVSEK